MPYNRIYWISMAVVYVMIVVIEQVQMCCFAGEVLVGVPAVRTQRWSLCGLVALPITFTVAPRIAPYINSILCLFVILISRCRMDLRGDVLIISRVFRRVQINVARIQGLEFKAVESDNVMWASRQSLLIPDGDVDVTDFQLSKAFLAKLRCSPAELMRIRKIGLQNQWAGVLGCLILLIINLGSAK